MNRRKSFIKLWMAGAVCLWALGARTASAEPKGWIANTSAMFFFNSTQQGGQGPSGSTLLTQTELIYSGRWWSLGAFYQYDKQGSAETDSGAGPKLELHWRAFYFEWGYMLLMKRAFTDRSIASQGGNGMVFGLGVRFPLKGGGGAVSRGGKGPYLQFNYKYRIQNINSQDGVDLDQGITQTDGYPTFGIGYDF